MKIIALIFGTLWLPVSSFTLNFQNPDFYHYFFHHEDIELHDLSLFEDIFLLEQTDLSFSLISEVYFLSEKNVLEVFLISGQKFTYPLESTPTLLSFFKESFKDDNLHSYENLNNFFKQFFGLARALNKIDPTTISKVVLTEDLISIHLISGEILPHRLDQSTLDLLTKFFHNIDTSTKTLSFLPMKTSSIPCCPHGTPGTCALDEGRKNNRKPRSNKNLSQNKKGFAFKNNKNNPHFKKKSKPKNHIIGRLKR